MNEPILLLPIVVPVAVGLLVLAIRRHAAGVREGLTLLVTLANLALAIFLFDGEKTFTYAWAGHGLEFSLRLYHFSSFILAAAAGFAFLVALYTPSSWPAASASTSSTATSSSPWASPTAPSWPTTSSRCSSSGKACWARSSA